MYPNLFVIGAAKSGTTSLHYYLDQHPDVHMSQEKEPNFFSYAHRTDGPKHVVRDERAYQALFDTDLPVRGESSVTYSMWPYPDGVPDRIHAKAPDARFVYVVRDPVARAISHYRHRIVLGEEHRTIQQVIADPDEPHERYLTTSSYATQLDQYLRLFPLDRFLVVDQSDLRTDRDGVLRRCFAFLGVDETFTSPAWERQLNETDGQRQYSALADRIRLSAPYRRTLGWVSPERRSTLLGPVKRLMSNEVAIDEEMGPDVHAYFAEQLAPEAARLRELLGRDFPAWSV